MSVSTGAVHSAVPFLCFAPCGGGDNRTRLAFSPMAKTIVLPPSSWRQATVHRTVAFRSVRVLFLPYETKKTPHWVSFLFGGDYGTRLNHGSARSSPRRRRSSAPHLDGFESLRFFSTKKKNHTVWCGFFLVETTGLEPVTSCV